MLPSQISLKLAYIRCTMKEITNQMVKDNKMLMNCNKTNGMIPRKGWALTLRSGGGLISTISPTFLSQKYFAGPFWSHKRNYSIKEMKNENVHMQALHRKLAVVLVQILPYNCSETVYSFCEDRPPSRTPPFTRMRVSPSELFSPPQFFFALPPLNLCK